jgi:transposase
VPIDPASLPNDIDELKRLVLEQQAKLVASTIEIEHLKLLIAKLRRLQFGRSSEKGKRPVVTALRSDR